MAEFKPEEMDDLDQDTFDSLRKDDLIALANFLKVEVKRSMRKREIQYRIAKHLVDLGQFEESTLKDYEPESTSELRKLELELQTNLEIKKLELQMEKERQALEKEKIQMQLEMEERQREKDRQERLEMKRLELGQSGKSFPSHGFDITKHFRLVPPFQEKDVDKYFLHFEKIAQSLDWPKESWSMLLQSALVGKAREIYIQLSVEQASDYDSVKELILKGYELVPEAYRQKFRDCEKVKDQTYVEFARTKEQLFDRWCSSEKVSQNYDKLRQLVLIEEFKRCIRSDIKTFINEQKADTLEVAARLADDYSLTHKSSFLSKPSQSFSTETMQVNLTPPFHPRIFQRTVENQMTTVHRVQVTLPHHQIPSLNLLLTNSSVHFLVIIVRKTAI
ncbi:uncharacterized protein [Ptychodera flava]|uniref:uncharacterized protein n=1 Tax=Ptychodera flava TaxID=63121 RepID=UPI00396A3BA1